MYDLCGEGLAHKLTQQKSLEEILKQELAWTLEQVGNRQLEWWSVWCMVLFQLGEEEEVEEEQPVESFTNQAFKADDET